MTITPVRLLQEGEPARQPSTLNRPIQDILFGSGYAADGSDFAGFSPGGGVLGLSGVFNLRSFTTLVNGVNDNSAEFQAGIDATAAVNGTMIVPSGDYFVPTMLTIPSNVSIIGTGFGSRVIGQVADRLFFATGSDNITIQNLSIEGSMAWGIYIVGGAGHKIQGNSVTGGTSLYNSGQGGIYLQDASRSDVDRNYCYGNGNGVNESNYDILVYAPNATINDCRITNNHCTSTGVFINIGLYNGVRCTVAGNEATGAYTPNFPPNNIRVIGGYGITLYNFGASVSFGNTVLNNHVHDVQGCGIYLARQYDTVVMGNHVKETGSVQLSATLPVAGISIDVSPGTICIGNRIEASNKDAIVVTGTTVVGSNHSEFSVIMGNVVTGTAANYKGVNIRGEVEDVLIQGNGFNGLPGVGIGSWSNVVSKRVSIIGNHFRGMTVPFTSEGIFAAALTEEWTITDNVFSDVLDPTLAIVNLGTTNVVRGNRVNGSMIFDVATMPARFEMAGDGAQAGVQIQLGTSNLMSTLGARRSGGDAYLATNAKQLPGLADSWAQLNAARPSTLLLLDVAGDVAVYACPAGRAPGAFGAFWGAQPKTSMKIGGGIAVNGVDVLSAQVGGWPAQSATASRADIGSSPTTAQLASLVSAIVNDLKGAHHLFAS